MLEAVTRMAIADTDGGGAGKMNKPSELETANPLTDHLIRRNTPSPGTGDEL